MLLWITVLSNRQLEPKWLPCYLDMQNTQNLQMVSTLITTHSYRLVLFTLESAQKSVKILRSSINPAQQENLKPWVQQTQQLPFSSQPLVGKKLLKRKYKQIQSSDTRAIEY
jgi:serine/threonine-protein kinase